jgi:hypothetical protein
MSFLFDDYFERDILPVKDRYVLIDTRFTYDHGWETMVFPCDKDGDNWGDEIDVERYISKEDAQNGHQKYVKKWELEGKNSKQRHGESHEK